MGGVQLWKAELGGWRRGAAGHERNDVLLALVSMVECKADCRLAQTKMN